MLHTATELRQLQSRYTAARVFIVGVELGLEEHALLIAAPLNPTFQPAVPYGIRTVPMPSLSQPARWIRVCGLWFLCAVTVKDALERLTTVTALGPGEEPGDLKNLSPETRLERHMTHAVVETIRDEEALLIHGNPTAPEPKGILNVAPLKAAYKPGVSVSVNGACGCGEPLCAHGMCATCDGLACGDCAGGGRDK